MTAAPGASESGSNAGYHWLPLAVRVPFSLPVLPEGAVVGGSSAHCPFHPFYIARTKAPPDGAWEVAMFSEHREQWMFRYCLDGVEHTAEMGEVLIAPANTYPVFVNGAFGEDVPIVLNIQGATCHQIVGRAHCKYNSSEEWRPGKVVPQCGKLFFPYGQRESTARRYQVLTTGLVWNVPTAKPAGALVFDPDSQDVLIQPGQRPKDVPPHAVLTRVSDAIDVRWVKSGDGEFVRHAVAGAQGAPIARVWRTDKVGGPGWVIATPPRLALSADAELNGMLLPDYEVLVAVPSVGGSSGEQRANNAATPVKATEECLASSEIFSVVPELQAELDSAANTTQAALEAELEAEFGSILARLQADQSALQSKLQRNQEQLSAQQQALLALLAAGSSRISAEVGSPTEAEGSGGQQGQAALPRAQSAGSTGKQSSEYELIDDSASSA